MEIFLYYWNTFLLRDVTNRILYENIFFSNLLIGDTNFKVVIAFGKPDFPFVLFVFQCLKIYIFLVLNFGTLDDLKETNKLRYRPEASFFEKTQLAILARLLDIQSTVLKHDACIMNQYKYFFFT